MQQYRDIKVSWPITLDELQGRMGQCWRVQFRIGLGRLMVIVGFFVLSIPIVTWLDANQTSIWYEIAWVCAAIAVFTFSILSWHRGMMKQLELFGLVCPSCKTKMGHYELKSVVVSGKCRDCGTLLISNHSPKAEQGAAE